MKPLTTLKMVMGTDVVPLTIEVNWTDEMRVKTGKKSLGYQEQ